jgi:AAA15 family ATPase/GTPase
MLENIHIQNFRCFEDFEANGFERVNLIGGKNNSGKSCLLDSIATFAKNFNLFNIASIRPALSTWSNFIYTYNEADEVFVNSNNIDINFKIKAQDRQFVGFEKSGDLINTTYTTHLGVVPLAGYTLYHNKDIKNNLLEILTTIDTRIIDVMPVENDTKLLVKIEHREFELMNNFGDAVTHLVNFFTPFLQKKFNKDTTNSLLLIDEVENGIHYTAHQYLWENIFKLSKELNVQVFATTHSLEMIQQFNKVAKEEGEAAYFEMGREYETGKIFAFKHDTELLSYELEPLEAFESSHPKPKFRGG